MRLFFLPLLGLGTLAKKLLMLSDLHLDSQYKPGSEIAAYCRGPAGVFRTAGPYGEVTCDSPRSLLSNLLAALTTAVPSVDFAVVGGDVGAHLDPTLTLSDYLDLYSQVLKDIQKHYGEIPLIPVLGNHDVPGLDFEDGPNRILKEYCELFSEHIPIAQREVFEEFGCYVTELISGPTFIVLNTLYFSVLNTKRCSDKTSSCHKQLAWLEETLKQLSLNKKTAYVLGHHPPTSVFYQPEAYAKLLSILSEFKTVVPCCFFSHIHEDTFFLLEKKKSIPAATASRNPKNAAFIIPSVVRNIHSRVRVFESDAKGILQDYTQYLVDVSRLDKKGGLMSQKEYSFCAEYSELPPLSANSLFSLNKKILSGKQYRHQYETHQHAK